MLGFSSCSGWLLEPSISIFFAKIGTLVFVAPEAAYDMLVHLAGPDVQFNFGFLSHRMIR
jgi:hypothetical protein